MSDLPPRPTDPPTDTGISANHDDTNWGEDWESAFQAEDETFFSEGKDEDFFLDEKEPPATAGVAGQEPSPSLEKPLAGIAEQTVPARGQAKKFRAWADKISAIFLSARRAVQKQLTRLQSFPLFIRIPLYGLPLLFIGLLFALSGTPKPPSLREPSSSPEQQPGAAIVSPSGTSTSPEDGQASLLHPGKVQKKWGFPSFIIPVNNPAEDQPVTFVLVDITLIAFLDAQEEPPAEKKIFVRDIIYQFFQNKQLEELRRFSLARDEMNRELRAWLQKQWPEAPIEAIIFNQYLLS
jgi:hypothetical protein